MIKSTDPIKSMALGIIYSRANSGQEINVPNEWRRLLKDDRRFAEALNAYERTNPYYAPKHTFEAHFKQCMRIGLNNQVDIVTRKGGHRVRVRKYPLALRVGGSNDFVYKHWAVLTEAEVQAQSRERAVKEKRESAHKQFAAVVAKLMATQRTHQMTFAIYETALKEFAKT